MAQKKESGKMEIEIVQRDKYSGIHIAEYNGKIEIELNQKIWKIDKTDMPKLVHIYKKWELK